MGRPKVALTIPEAWAARSLLDVVQEAAGLPAAVSELVITRGAVWVGRYRVQETSRRVASGDALTIHFPPTNNAPASVSSADVLYEDASLLVLNKPPGVYVAATPWDVTADLLSAVHAFLQARDGQAPPLHLAHRLDRDTSGVLVVSKDPAANAALQSVFLQRDVRKCYQALAEGCPQHDAFMVRTGHGRGAYGLFRVYPVEAVGTHPGQGEHARHVVKLMETRFVVRERFTGATFVEAYPITGRTHQIRLHLTHLGFPLLGDSRYGGPTNVAGIDLPHHLLHAAALDLPHPMKKERLHFEAPLPPVFARVLTVLRDE